MTKTPVHRGIGDAGWQDVPRLRSPRNGDAHGLPTGHLPRSFREASGLPPGAPALHEPDRTGPRTPALRQAASHWRLLTGVVTSMRCPHPAWQLPAGRAHVACSCITSLHGPRAGSTPSPSLTGGTGATTSSAAGATGMWTPRTQDLSSLSSPGASGSTGGQDEPDLSCGSVGKAVTVYQPLSHRREQTHHRCPARALQGVDSKSHPPQPPLGCLRLSQIALGRTSIQE